MRRRMFNTILGLCLLDASGILPLVVTTENVSRCCQMSFGGQNYTQLRISAIKGPE